MLESNIIWIKDYRVTFIIFSELVFSALAFLGSRFTPFVFKNEEDEDFSCGFMRGVPQKIKEN